MQEILYIEIPTPHTEAVRQWLHKSFDFVGGQKTETPDGFRMVFVDSSLVTTQQHSVVSEDLNSGIASTTQTEQQPQELVRNLTSSYEQANHATDPSNSISFESGGLPKTEFEDSSDSTSKNSEEELELSVFVWSVQRTTYLKVFRWGDRPVSQESDFLKQLTCALRLQFPHQYPELPEIDLTERSIFEALQPYYPTTVKYFRRMPNGEFDLNRVYWWEKRWREGVRAPQMPKQVIFQTNDSFDDELDNENSLSHHSQKNQSSLDASNKVFVKNDTHDLTKAYDLIYVGGALGVIHAAVMAQRGYRVLLIERLPFGRMNREWNISRAEFQSLIDLGLFTAEDFESMIACEYVDGFNKFFDANNPPQAKAPVLKTPTVLNIAIDAERLLRMSGDRLLAAGGAILDETEFEKVIIHPNHIEVCMTHLPSGKFQIAQGRLLVDAMGTASPIAWQINQGRAFDSVCPTVGAIISGGFPPGVWDSRYGDVLNSHGDISRGRQLIWELFPGRDDELTIYLFHYHQVHPDNPGSLLEMYEDFFNILPEYRRCDVDNLTWRKATFGYIPGYFSTREKDRTIAFDRLVAIGDAASLQSPLVFTGFGSLVRNLGRLTHILDTALRHDLVKAHHLNQIRAYQSNIAVTWLFSKGMMVPTGTYIPPERVNAMLNTFFGILGSEPPDVADQFIKDRAGWYAFNRMALKAAMKNPKLLLWIWQLAGPRDLFRWVGSYLNFTFHALLSWLLQGLPAVTKFAQPWLEPMFPGVYLWMLAQSYALFFNTGRTRLLFKPDQLNKSVPSIQ